MKSTILSIIERAEKAMKDYEASEQMDHLEGRKEGASQQQLQQLQDKFAFQLPYSFMEFYHITNGYEELTLLMDLFDIDSMLSNKLDHLYGILDDNIEALDDADWAKNINRDDIEKIGKDNCLIFGERGNKVIFINFNKPFPNGEYQIVSLSYEYAEAWDSFPDFLKAQAKYNENLVDWKKEKINALNKEWEPSVRNDKDQKVKKLFSKRLLKKSKQSKPVKSFLWKTQTTDIESPEKLIGHEKTEGEIVRVLHGLTFYMPYSPTAQEIKLVYRIYRKHIPWRQMVHIQNTETYTSLKKETSAEDWEFIDTLLEGNNDKYSWGLRAVDYPHGKSVENLEDCENWFNFRSAPDKNGKPCPAFLAIHFKTGKDTDTLLAMAKEITEVIPFISGHAGYETFQSRINYKPTIETEYQWAKRYAGIRIEDEDYLPYMWDRIWPANWLTMLGSHILSVCEEQKYDWQGLLEKEMDIDIHIGKYGSIIQAGKEPALGDVYKGEWPKSYSMVQSVINPLTIHPTGKSDVTFAGRFDEENMTAAWFDRFIRPEKFYRMGEKEAIWYPVKLAKKKASKDKIEKAIDELKNYDGKGSQSSMEIFSASYSLQKDFNFSDLSTKMLVQALKWPNTHISCYNNLLVYLLGEQNLKDARKYLPACIKAADNGLREGEKRAGGVYWNIACVEAREGNLDKALEYIRKAKETGYEQFQRLHSDEDFKELWTKKEFEELF